MQVRKDRQHIMGAANTDSKTRFRVFGTNDQQALIMTGSRLDFLASKHSKKNDPEDTKRRLLQSAGNPKAEALEATKTFYKESNKTLRDQIKLGFPRSSQLEEQEKRKIVFTGDSHLIYDKHFESYAPRERETLPRRKTPGQPSKIAHDKHEENAKATQETQLVGMEGFIQETLKNKVDLHKVKEVRRAIRRRYANRKNMKKIFSTWDEENVGRISVKNVYNLVNRLGININFDEARVLVASANKSGTGELALDEFLELIYNTDDALNVNLDRLPVQLSEDLLIQKEDIEKQGLLGYLQEDAARARQIKHENQVKLILKNRLSELNTNFFTEDQAQAGNVNYEKFEKVLKKLGISESVVTENDFKSIFERHKVDQHNMNYRGFLNELNDFKFNPDDIYKQQVPKETSRPGLERSKTATTMYRPRPDPIAVVDARNMPFPTLENFFTKNMRIGRHLKRLFPHKKDFMEYAAKALNVDTEKAKDQCLSNEELKTFFGSIFDKIDANFSKRDFEGFYSSFIYNRNGYTDLNEVGYTIYEEDIKKFHQRAQEQVHGPAPHKDIALADAEFYQESNPNDEQPPQEYFSGITTYPRLSKTAVPRSRSTGKTELTNQLAYDLGNTDTFEKEKEIIPILQRIEDRLFTGRPRVYDIFKKFDVDKDGYVSHKDFVAKVEEMNLATKEETKKLLQYVDPENKGYVTFSEFNKKLRADMAERDEQGNFKIMPSTVPNREIHNRIKRNLEYVKQRDNELREPYFKPSTSEKKTRYGATPAWANTFLHFQPPSESPMFLSEEKRFARDPNARVRFQKDEKAKKLMAEAMRIEGIKTHSNFFKQKVEYEEAVKDIREQNKMKTKLEAQMAYEQQCQLKNQYL